MRRVIGFGLIVGLAIGLSACSNSSVTSPSPLQATNTGPNAAFCDAYDRYADAGAALDEARASGNSQAVQQASQQTLVAFQQVFSNVPADLPANIKADLKAVESAVAASSKNPAQAEQYVQQIQGQIASLTAYAEQGCPN